MELLKKVNKIGPLKSVVVHLGESNSSGHYISHTCDKQRRSQGGGLKGLKPPPLAIRKLMFIS